MKRLAVSAMALAVAACSGAGRCDLEVSRTIAFTAENAADTVRVLATGPACDKAIGSYEIRDAEGHPIWVWAAPLPRAFGDVFPAQEREVMRDFLARWSQPSIARTSTAPAWSDLGPGLTTLDQLTFEDIRARDLPLLCHASATGRETCVFWEPAAGGAGHFYDREMEDQ